MSLRRVSEILLIASFGAALSSCSGSTVDDAVPTGSPTSQQGGTGEVPQVANPLDATPFLKNPCALIDDQTLSQFGDFTEGEPDVDSNHAQKLIGPRCSWYMKEDYSRSAGVVIDTPHQKYADPELRGLGGVYASKESGMIDFLQAVEIAGHPDYPAVIAGDREEISRGRCVVYVGIANDLTINTSFDDEQNPSQACPAAQKIASAALETLKQGG